MKTKIVVRAALLTAALATACYVVLSPLSENAS